MPIARFTTSTWHMASRLNVFAPAASPSQIGITVNLSTPRPATSREEDLHAADRATDGQSRIYLDPLFGRGYPDRHLAVAPAVEMPVEPGDMERIAAKIDLLGLNYYWEKTRSPSTLIPPKSTASSRPITTRLRWAGTLYLRVSTVKYTG